MKEILVTGGPSYFGSQNCKALGRNSAQVSVFGDLFTGHRYAEKWAYLNLVIFVTLNLYAPYRASAEFAAHIYIFREDTQKRWDQLNVKANYP